MGCKYLPCRECTSFFVFAGIDGLDANSYGFGLQLVAAALGATVTPFNLTQDTAESLSSSSSRIEGLQARRKAESYYQYARRRFGLLDRSLTACHCHLISGVYLMYTLRPAQAWQAFFDASTLYTLYLRSREAAKAWDEHDTYSQDELRCQLEQRLYWSCIKSERQVSTREGPDGREY